jgi:carboxyl-terminal processing protease
MFLPPPRATRVEYGFATQMVGNDCVVTAVKKGSDAEKKGLKPGDAITAFGRFQVTRDNLWEINYNLYALSPIASVRLTFRGEDSSTREITVNSEIKSREQRIAEEEARKKERNNTLYKCQQVSSDTIGCRLETFSVPKDNIDKMMTEAAKYPKMILDLRGNGGGSVAIEEDLTGHFCDKEVKIGTTISRKDEEERTAKPQDKHAFKGQLVVLVDSNSASASEIFSRVIQLQKRGTIVGDVTAGAVMTSFRIWSAGEKGTSAYYVFGVSVTVSDVVMSDGNRLENIGVTPDRLVGPTREAWSMRSDPVLAYAADLLGARLSAEDAAKFHFFKSRYEDDEKSDESKAEEDK